MTVQIQQHNGASTDHLRCYTKLIALSVLCFAAVACTDGAGGGLGAVVSNELIDPASGATCSEGSNVRIAKNDFETVLSGQCGAVVITGSNGSVNVDHALSIRVEGTEVTVLNEKVETLEAIGSDNTFNMPTRENASCRAPGKRCKPSGPFGTSSGAPALRGYKRLDGRAMWADRSIRRHRLGDG